MIVITDLPRPNLNEPDNWGSLTVVHQQWLRQAAPQLGLDTRRAIIGEALGTILGDDGNCFALQRFFPELNDGNKRELLIRLGYEINTVELPEVIRQNLQTVRDRVAALDWHDEGQYNQARELWVSGAKEFTKREVADNPDLRNAISYYKDVVSKRIKESWKLFIYGEKAEKSK